MANYKKYAENLIGNWEKDIYEPQKEVTKAIYQTNWDKLTNDYNDVRDKLARNFDLARNEYNNTLNDIQNASFNRMNNANIDLANRGLTSSGVMNLVNQADTQEKGEETDEALAKLLGVNNATLEGLREGVIGLGEGQNSLAGNLAKDIAGLTDADAANNQEYGGLVAGIAQSAAGRAASRAGSGGKSKRDKDLDEMYRELGVIQTMYDDSLTDDEKRTILMRDYDLDLKTTNAALTGYSNNSKLETTNKEIERLQESIAKQAQDAKAWNDFANSVPLGGGGGMLRLFNAPNANVYYGKRNLEKARNSIDGLTYQDLNDILFGNK